MGQGSLSFHKTHAHKGKIGEGMVGRLPIQGCRTSEGVGMFNNGPVGKMVEVLEDKPNLETPECGQQQNNGQQLLHKYTKLSITKID